jgi:two-component system, OmpR family, catabolic regulation response regulator CreB
MAQTKILVFEDERSIAETLLYALTTEGFQAKHVTTGEAGLKLFAEEPFDLIILDVGLPDLSGFEICKRIRQSSNVPIFFLTARSAEIDKIVGLEIGADDYITKPFSPREVTTRIKTIFRRIEASKPQAASGPKLSLGPFTVDAEKFQITLSGQLLELTRYEFGLLQVLLKAPGRVYSRAQLMELVWDTPDMSLERTIDTHVKALRMKLKALDPREFILTHRGIGYSFTEDFS